MQDYDYAAVGAGYYDDILHHDVGVRCFWHKHKFAQIASLIDSDENSTILDVGCAAGSFIGTLKKKYKLAVGVDVAPAQIEYANQQYAAMNRKFISADVRSLQYEEASFDFIVMSEVVEHISFDEACDVLKRLFFLLKPLGKLILTTPNYRSLWPVLEWVVNRVSPVTYEHQHINKLYSSKCVLLLEKAGFQVDHLSSFFVLGPFFSVFSKPIARLICRLETALLPKCGSILLVAAFKRKQ